MESLEREERIVAIPDIPTADVVRIGQITWEEKADLMRYFSWEEKADLMRYFSWKEKADLMRYFSNIME